MPGAPFACEAILCARITRCPRDGTPVLESSCTVPRQIPVGLICVVSVQCRLPRISMGHKPPKPAWNGTNDHEYSRSIPGNHTSRIKFKRDLSMYVSFTWRFSRRINLAVDPSFEERNAWIEHRKNARPASRLPPAPQNSTSFISYPATPRDAMLRRDGVCISPEQ